MGLKDFFGITQPTDDIEKLVIESVNHLKKYNPSLQAKDLEAEAIYLAAFVFLKDDYRIDFKVDYLSADLLTRIPSEDYKISDKVFYYMRKHYSDKYGDAEMNHGVTGYKMNIQLAPDYGSYIKNYFIKAHKISAGTDYLLFSSPKNSLWNNEKHSGDSPTQRDVYYKFGENSFELMIPPYNPLVTGRVTSKKETEIKCQSSDLKRTFVFNYKTKISPETLDSIEMYRHDKNDKVVYHR